MHVKSARAAVPVAVALAAWALSAAATAAQPPAQLWTERQPQETGLDRDSPVTMSAFARLAKLISPTVINISTSSIQRGYVRNEGSIHPYERLVPRGQGTGFFIHEDGFALTNNHVIESADKITVRTADDRTFEARVIGSDPRTDLALIKIDAAEKFAVAPLGDSDALEIGEWVVAVGNPFGLSHTVTAGIVSAKERSEVRPGGREIYASYIQTDASINPGNSGGPLVNIRGEVVGINTAVNAAGQGIGFAIPANMAKKLLPQLGRGRIVRSWLGVSVRELDADDARTLGLERMTGALIEAVVPDSPAEEGGIRPGDVILRFDDHEVRHATDLPWLAASGGIGEVAAVDLVRAGKPLSLKVKLASLPRRFGGRAAEAPPPTSTGPTAIPGLGVAAVTLTGALQRRFRLAVAQGALVVQVDRGGPADLAGIRVGDVVVQSGAEAIRGADDLARVGASYQRREVVPLRIQRGRQMIYIAPRKGR